MAEIINLRRARKAKDKAARASQADENRIRFGRTKAERQRSAAEAAIAAGRVEGHRLTVVEDKPEPSET